MVITMEEHFEESKRMEIIHSKPRDKPFKSLKGFAVEQAPPIPARASGKLVYKDKMVVDVVKG